VARILIVGCGHRGQALARELIAEGHQVRGSTRSKKRFVDIEVCGAEAVTADPDRIATLMPVLQGSTVVVWLMGSANGSSEAVAALHTTRLEMMLLRLIDSGVRGFVYEAAGSVDGKLLCAGAGQVNALSEQSHVPVSVVSEKPEPLAEWVAAMKSAVSEVLSQR